MSQISLSPALAIAPPLRLGTRMTNALNGVLVFDLFDDAIADLLCLHTYIHGTSPKCYNNIMRVGADPAYGGQGGGERGWRKSYGEDSCASDKGRFFVFPHDAPEFFKRIMPRGYSIIACIGENCSPQQNKLKKGALKVASFFQSLCSPNLKFRFLPSEAARFKRDESFHMTRNFAAFTEQPIDPDHIGLYGSFCKGLNADWGSRIQQNPLQFAKGLLKLVATISLVALAVFAAMSYSFVATALAVYLVIKSFQIVGSFFVPMLSRGK